MKKLKCAVVGVGYLGKFHAEKYASLENAELVGVVDINKEQLSTVSQKLKVPGFTDYRQLIGKVDAVSIVVPTVLHYEVAKFFLQKGVHVLVEKPMTITLEEADELIAVAKENNVLLQVGMLERFNAASVALRDILNRPLFIECNRIAPFNPRCAASHAIPAPVIPAPIITTSNFSLERISRSFFLASRTVVGMLINKLDRHI